MTKWPASPIKPVYGVPGPNDPIVLYEGPLTFDFGSGPQPGQGRISHVWQPRSAHTFEFTEDGVSQSIGYSGGPLTIPSLGVTVPAQIRSAKRVSGEGFRFEGVVPEFVQAGSLDDVDHVVVHLANVRHFPNAVRRRWDVAPPMPSGRVLLAAAGWQVILDPINDSRGIQDALDDRGGFGITHVGRIEREDGSSFGMDDFEHVLDMLASYLSFGHGYWIEPFLPLAYGVTGEESWRAWKTTDADSWQRPGSWLPYDESWTLGSLFESFAQRWDDPTWGEPLRLALYWYLEANAPGRGIEGAIILQQVALELLAWVQVVEDSQAESGTAFDRRPAGEQVRMLLAKTRVPNAIPSALPNLMSFARQMGSTDGPHVLTDVRNKFVHPRPDTKRRLVMGAPLEVLREARCLGVWYLELVLLSILGHQAYYANRLADGQTALVPWATGAPPEKLDV